MLPTPKCSDKVENVEMENKQFSRKLTDVVPLTASVYISSRL